MERNEEEIRRTDEDCKIGELQSEMDKSIGFASETGELKANPSLGHFIKEFFRNYKSFLQRYLVLKKPPFLFILIWLLGMSSVIDRIETGYILSQKYELENWEIIWGAILLGGLLSGYLAYWIGGAVYHLRVRLSGGAKNPQISRNLFLYTGLPIYLVTVFSELGDTFVYGNRYFTEPTNSLLDLTWLGLTLIGITYSIILSYRGVRILQNTKPVRSLIFFIVLPAIFYSFLFAGTWYKFDSQYSTGLNYNEKAIELMSTGDYDKAERFFKLALKKMTKDDREDIITIHCNLGLLYEYKGAIEQSIECYEKALSFNEPGSSGYHSLFGRINILRGNTYEAIRDFVASLRLNPDNFDAHNYLGVIFLGEVDEETIDYERALIHNEKAYSLNKTASSIQNLAVNYCALDRYEEALPLLEHLITISPNNAIANYFLGLIHYTNNDLPNAKVFLRQALTLDPSLHNEYVDGILHEE